MLVRVSSHHTKYISYCLYSESPADSTTRRCCCVSSQHCVSSPVVTDLELTWRETLSSGNQPEPYTYRSLTSEINQIAVQCQSGR